MTKPGGGTKASMHQSSQRVLRWMEDGRPHSKDLFELFGVLITALPLKMHRVRLQKRYHSLTTYDALHKLGNLKFTHSNKRPSPDDPNVQLVTHLVTTYAMVPEMARMLCQAFLAARLLESCEGKTDFLSGDSVWQLTPKSINLLQSFANRNGVQDRHVFEVIDSPRNSLHLLVLERDHETDKIIQDRATIEVIFRRFAGMYGPNYKTNVASSDSDSINELPNGLAGVKLLREKRVNGRTYPFTFTGRAAIDWLMDCCTFVNEKEAAQIAALFLNYGMAEFLSADEPASTTNRPFSPSKSTIYRITKFGQQAARWIPRDKEVVNGDVAIPKSNGTSRDSNKARMMVILNTPSLRMLFREFLRDTHCEENLVFYQDVSSFLTSWEAISLESQGEPPLAVLRETLASSYDLYNSFLAPGSPCELNIDHSLRFAVLKRMTKPELEDNELLHSVNETIELFRQAKNSVFKLMASDSAPKFIRDSRYADYILDYHVDESDARSSSQSPTVGSAI